MVRRLSTVVSLAGLSISLPHVVFDTSHRRAFLDIVFVFSNHWK